MNATDYQNLAMRTNDGKSTDRLTCKIDGNLNGIDIGGILNGCLGLSGETGEFNDMIKKWIFHEKDLDVDHAKKEMGDVLWYVAMLCHSFGWDMSEIMQMNVDKLKSRYPEGFSTQLSNHRKAGDV